MILSNDQQDYLWGVYKLGDLLKYQSRAQSV